MSVIISSLKLRSRNTAGRSAMDPAGNDQHDFVRIGNLLGDRLVLLCMVISSVAAGRFFIEQPGASSFPTRPRFQWMLSVIKVRDKSNTI